MRSVLLRRVRRLAPCVGRRALAWSSTCHQALHTSPGSASTSSSSSSSAAAATASDVNAAVENQVSITGWVKTIRSQKTVDFITINDGTTHDGIQVVVETGHCSLPAGLTTGSSVSVSGSLVTCPPSAAQDVEVFADNVSLVGPCPSTYPIQKKYHSLEFLRDEAHLRTRTNTHGAVARVRNEAMMGLHKFFQTNGFAQVSTPCITPLDCEGAGELFEVNTAHAKPGDKFFGKSAYLSVSGQLYAEMMASSLRSVYTFGPTFRAENSHTSRHLAEFWMLEPEMAFADLSDAADMAEACIKSTMRHVMDNCARDLEFFDQHISKGLLANHKTLIDAKFARITYTDAVEVLINSKQTFEYPVKWGVSLQSEHERYLCEQHFKCPTFVTDYPAAIKPFYMKLNPPTPNGERDTVACMDLLVPGVGELIGGSQREDMLDVLSAQLEKHGLDKEQYSWYLDLRRYGSVPHAGFGMGFERFLQMITGMGNVRDVIPVPRVQGEAHF